LAVTVITCISNEESFGKEVYEYLYSELEKQQQYEEGKELRITSALIMFVAESNEIHIDESAKVPNGMIKWILERYIKSNPARFEDYDIIQFGDTFTIGKLLPAREMGLYSCEICSYSTPYQEELYTHRMMHYGL
jgi:hypothetical protein